MSLLALQFKRKIFDRLTSAQLRVLGLLTYLCALACIVICLDAFSRGTEVEEHGFAAGYASPSLETALFERRFIDAREALQRKFRASTYFSFVNRTVGAGADSNPKSARRYLSRRQTTDEQWSSRRNMTDCAEYEHPVGTALVELLGSEVPTARPSLVQRIPFAMDREASDGRMHRRCSEAVHAVAPTQRGDSRDSFIVVLSFDWNNPNEIQLAALGAALLAHMTEVTWSSRDVSFVFVDRTLAFARGVREFVREVLHETPHAIQGTTTLFRGGLAIEAQGTADPSGLQYDIEGPDGHLPNQDLVNVFSGAAQVAQCRVSPRPMWVSLLRQILNSGIERPHSPLLEMQIPAFTVTTKLEQSNFDQILRISRTVEAFLRYESNTLQSLHHSFNFYIFTGLKNHVSSGVYMLPAVFLLAAILSRGATIVEFQKPAALLSGFSVIGGTCLAVGGPGLLLALGKVRIPRFGVATPSCSFALTEQEKLRPVALWISTAAVGFVAEILALGFILSGMPKERQKSLASATACAGMISISLLCSALVQQNWIFGSAWWVLSTITWLTSLSLVPTPGPPFERSLKIGLYSLLTVAVSLAAVGCVIAPRTFGQMRAILAASNFLSFLIPVFRSLTKLHTPPRAIGEHLFPSGEYSSTYLPLECYDTESEFGSRLRVVSNYIYSTARDALCTGSSNFTLLWFLLLPTVVATPVVVSFLVAMSTSWKRQSCENETKKLA